jgi:ribonuclease BN (tRNA processing enzyme)
MASSALWRLAQTRVSYKDVGTVLLSHAHPDHCAGVVPLVQALLHTPGFTRTEALRICGPQPVLEFVDQLLRTYPGCYPTWPLDWCELKDGSAFTMGTCTVTCREMAHTRPTLGYRFEQDGASLAYTADTAPCDALIDLLTDVDLALMECSFARGAETTKHLTTETAGEMARKAGVRSVVFTHLYPDIARIPEAQRTAEVRAAGYDGPITYAEDLLRIPITPEVAPGSPHPAGEHDPDPTTQHETRDTTKGT